MIINGDFVEEATYKQIYSKGSNDGIKKYAEILKEEFAECLKVHYNFQDILKTIDFTLEEMGIE